MASDEEPCVRKPLDNLADLIAHLVEGRAAPRVCGILAGADQLQEDPRRGLLLPVQKLFVDRLSRVGERPFQAAHGVVRVVTRRKGRSVIWWSA